MPGDLDPPRRHATGVRHCNATINAPAAPPSILCGTTIPLPTFFWEQSIPSTNCNRDLGSSFRAALAGMRIFRLAGAATCDRLRCP
jgi:hypothetical protein